MPDLKKVSVCICCLVQPSGFSKEMLSKQATGQEIYDFLMKDAGLIKEEGEKNSRRFEPLVSRDHCISGIPPVSIRHSGLGFRGIFFRESPDLRGHALSGQPDLLRAVLV